MESTHYHTGNQIATLFYLHYVGHYTTWLHKPIKTQRSILIFLFTSEFKQQCKNVLDYSVGPKQNDNESIFLSLAITNRRQYVFLQVTKWCASLQIRCVPFHESKLSNYTKTKFAIAGSIFFYDFQMNCRSFLEILLIYYIGSCQKPYI